MKKSKADDDKENRVANRLKQLDINITKKEDA